MTAITGRPWTDQEREQVKEMRCRGVGLKVIARKIGRTLNAVQSYTVRAGLLMYHKDPAELKRLVRRYHRRGWHDADIADHIGISRGYASQVRRDLGLPVQAQAVAIGRGRANASRTERDRVTSVMDGWPEVTAATRRILEAVQPGRVTVIQVCQHCGLKSLPRMSDRLSRLRKQGLVVAERRQGSRSRMLYSLEPTVAANRERVRSYQSGEIPD